MAQYVQSSVKLHSFLRPSRYTSLRTYIVLLVLFCLNAALSEPTITGDIPASATVPKGEHDPGIAQQLYDKWKTKADAAMANARAELKSGNWPDFGTSDEEWSKLREEANLKRRDLKRTLDPGQRAQEGTGPLQCLPIQRYREHYLQNAPDRDIATCRVLMFTGKAAPHLEPFSMDELFECGHCALLGGLHLTALHYLRRARSNSSTAAINYGTALYFAGNIPEAIHEWEKVIASDPIPNKLPNTEVAYKNLAFALYASGAGGDRPRELFLHVYEQAWVRTVRSVVDRIVPDSFVQEQVFRPLGIWRNEAMRSFQTETAPIVGTRWALESHEMSPGMTKLVVQRPRIAAAIVRADEEDKEDEEGRQHIEGGTLPQGGSSGGIGLSEEMLSLASGAMPATGALPRAHAGPIAVAPSTHRALNLYEFGLNRDLCRDPLMASDPLQKESDIQVLMSPLPQYAVPRAGRQYLAWLKRALVGLLDQSHAAHMVKLWGGGAPPGSSSLAHRPTQSMSLSLATLNRLNHSKYLDPPFPGYTLATVGLLNHLQTILEDVLNNDIPGDFVETGVWRGGQTILMRAVLDAAADATRHVWVCDSFEGVPAPRAGGKQDASVDETVEWEPGLYNASLETVQSNFRRFGLLDDRVHFVKGHFVTTMRTIEVQRISVLRLDADTWDATMDVLQALYDRVSEGGYIIIDDFHLTGARGATLEFRHLQGITDPLLPVPEDFVFSCGQLDESQYHSWPRKLPQAAYWRKGGLHSVVADDSDLG